MSWHSVWIMYIRERLVEVMPWTIYVEPTGAVTQPASRPARITKGCVSMAGRRRKPNAQSKYADLTKYDQALFWREQGLSYREVSEKLGVPKSTVADWLRNVGEYWQYRKCRLCGEMFRCYHWRRVYCCKEHGRKWERIYGARANKVRGS